jgi:hypothetical protein
MRAGTAAPISLSGAGATFPAPLYKKWIGVYYYYCVTKFGASSV